MTSSLYSPSYLLAMIFVKGMQNSFIFWLNKYYLITPFFGYGKVIKWQTSLKKFLNHWIENPHETFSVNYVIIHMCQSSVNSHFFIHFDFKLLICGGNHLWLKFYGVKIGPLLPNTNQKPPRQRRLEL